LAFSASLWKNEKNKEKIRSAKKKTFSAIITQNRYFVFSLLSAFFLSFSFFLDLGKT